MDKNVIRTWTPETAAFWQSTGRAVASRNMWISATALMLAFAVWMTWSMVVIHLPHVGFKYSTNQLFWLVALPGLSGAILRLVFPLMLPLFGGRKWTALSTAALLVPAIGIGHAVQDPATGYPTMIMLALLCGLGGGSFTSATSHIGHFYPVEGRDRAIGLHSAWGNFGVALMQFAVPVAIGAALFGPLGGPAQDWASASDARTVWLQNAGYIWVPAIAATSLLAWFGMNDIAAPAVTFQQQAVIFKRRHNWIMGWLYTGTFGSFIGYAAGFPLLVASQFPDADVLRYAFLGPLAGALGRAAGGAIAAAFGPARVTLWVFTIMAGAAFGVTVFLPQGGVPGNFAGFFWMFMLLFAASGVGNAATFRMIPVIFTAGRVRAAEGRGAAALAQAIADGGRESAAAIGFTSALAACGAFFIPKSFGSAIAVSGSPAAALVWFIIFYGSCIAITWWNYARRNASMPC
jgi:NNP family nitrate/nitrite transporter-like MFS transporter